MVGDATRRGRFLEHVLVSPRLRRGLLFHRNRPEMRYRGRPHPSSRPAVQLLRRCVLPPMSFPEAAVWRPSYGGAAGWVSCGGILPVASSSGAPSDPAWDGTSSASSI